MSKIRFVNLQLETDHLSNPETYKDNAKMPPIAPIDSKKFKVRVMPDFLLYLNGLKPLIKH